jgi:hypothetical protein
MSLIRRILLVLISGGFSQDRALEDEDIEIDPLRITKVRPIRT